MVHRSVAEFEHIVVTVHGIRTFGQWQQRLSKLIRKQDGNIRCQAFVYGYFSIFAFLVPPLRWLVTRRFRRHLEQLSLNHPEARIDLVGHSFGTHLIGWSLWGLRLNKDRRFGTIILAGSVLKPGFPWHELIATGTVKNVINDCGINDWVLVINQLVVLFTGMAGRVGFSGLTSEVFVNRFFEGGHSHYFVNKRGEATDQFMIDNWLPVLAGGREADAIDQRRRLTFSGGLLATVLQNTEPLKLTLYAIIFAAPASVYFSLYTQSKKDEVELRRSLIEVKKEREHAIAETARAEQSRRSTLRTLEWAVNQFTEVKFDSDEVSEEASVLIAGLKQRLDEAHFSGQIRLEGHVGLWCTEPGNYKVPRLARPNLSIQKCGDDGGATREFALGHGERMANAVSSLMQSDGLAAKTVNVISYGKEKPRKKYPCSTSGDEWKTCKATAGEWNKAAQANNYVEVLILDGSDVKR
ncbi:hypothetical protein [Dyella sp. GSA-30]|uniref:hypothetical protein n=1 Tax=Dyella sp. GSA-30 TaxID=2994496 RepID=UPI002491A175|nr:hypothetical protein [Dyella sp. GSA-30]